MSVKISRSPVRRSGSQPYLTAVFDKAVFQSMRNSDTALCQVTARKLATGDVELEFKAGVGGNARSSSTYAPTGGTRFQWPITGDLTVIPVTGLSRDIVGHVTQDGCYRIVLSSANIKPFIQRTRASTGDSSAPTGTSLVPSPTAASGQTLVAQGSVAEIVAELQRLGVKGSVTAITINL